MFSLDKMHLELNFIWQHEKEADPTKKMATFKTSTSLTIFEASKAKKVINYKYLPAKSYYLPYCCLLFA